MPRKAEATIGPLLKSHGLRDTQPRRMVVQALSHMQDSASAYDIQKWIADRGDTINAVTVYRVLEVFEELGMVHRHPVNGQYFLCTIPDQKGHHGFLHCTSCGKTDEFTNSALCKLENSIARDAGYVPSSHVSEIRGVCAGCRKE